jgi:hypothetical protein
MVFCSQCGANCPSGAFCNQCGTALAGGPEVVDVPEVVEVNVTSQFDPKSQVLASAATEEERVTRHIFADEQTAQVAAKLVAATPVVTAEDERTQRVAQAKAEARLQAHEKRQAELDRRSEAEKEAEEKRKAAAKLQEMMKYGGLPGMKKTG